jgi:pimeloyl-ACP methyl ester carboxylesterase
LLERTPDIISDFLATVDNQRIAYDLYQAGHRKLVVIAPGFYNSKDAVLIQRLKDLLMDCYDVLIFDFRGHGKSSGLFTWTSREGKDLESVLAYAAQRYATIGLIGFSYGAAVSMQHLAVHRDIATFIAISAPFDSMRIDYHFWDLDLENDILYNLGEGGRNKGVRPGPFWLKKVRPLDIVSEIACPVLYIHGQKDWVTGYYHSERLFEKTKTKKKCVIIKNGPHAEYLLREQTQQETITLIKGWLEETLL